MDNGIGATENQNLKWTSKCGKPYSGCKGNISFDTSPNKGFVQIVIPT
jgi:hypothetical protein